MSSRCSLYSEWGTKERLWNEAITRIQSEHVNLEWICAERYHEHEHRKLERDALDLRYLLHSFYSMFCIEFWSQPADHIVSDRISILPVAEPWSTEYE